MISDECLHVRIYVDTCNVYISIYYKLSGFVMCCDVNITIIEHSIIKGSTF